MLIRGEDGTVTLAGRLVARITRYQADYDPAGIDIDATTTDVNEFWLSRNGPFIVALVLGRERLTWREASVSRTGHGLQITADGRPEVYGTK